MNLVVSDPKTGKAYSKKLDSAAMFSGKRVGDEIELGLAGMDGYKAKIMGGSDKQGFPIRHDLEGQNRRKIYLTEDKKHGIRKKVSRRGKNISDQIVQINLKVTHEGKVKIDELLGGEKKEAKEERVSAKEVLVKQSLENVGKAPPVNPKDVKGKVKG